MDKKFRVPRVWSNQELKKFAPLFKGSIVNVSAWKDWDKENKRYKDYFSSAAEYWMTNYQGERGFQGNFENEYFLDLSTPPPPPSDMEVEITNRCNYQCIFCSHQANHAKMKNKFGEIDIEFLKRVLQEAYDMGLRRVGLYSTGEMFLCKEVASHIRNAKQIGYEYIYSDTNGLLATKENLKKVIDAGIHSIKFSINAGTRETYRLIHGHDAFDQVLENLKICYKLKQELNRKLRIMVSYVVIKQNENEIETLKKIVEPYITDDVMVHTVILGYMWRYNLKPEHLISEKMGYSKVSIPCTMVFNRIHITHDGYLTACCADFNHDLLLADLKHTALKDAWYGEKAMTLRKAHIDHNLKGILCNNCYQSIFQEYQSLKI